MRPRDNNLRVSDAHLMGRRFVPPLTPVPIVMGEEPWRERPRLGAMKAAPRLYLGSFTPRFQVSKLVSSAWACGGLF